MDLAEGGGIVPFTPSTETPFIGNTTPTSLGGTGWAYDNPFFAEGTSGVDPSSSAPSMSVPWGGSTRSMGSDYLLDAMTSVPLSTAFSRNNITKDMRTNHTVPYARPQNTDQLGFDFWRGFVEGLSLFLFTGRPHSTIWTAYDPEAEFYLSEGRRAGFNFGDHYEGYFQESPTRGFFTNYTLPQVNFLLASAEVSRSAYGGKYGPGCFTSDDVREMFKFDGICYNQEGGENPATGEPDMGKGVIYNLVIDGTHRNTRNIWGNSVGVLDKLWFICKRMPTPSGGYRINPNGECIRPQVPKGLIESLEDDTKRRIENKMVKNPWQFIPWSHPIKSQPSTDDLYGINEYGDREKGFAVYVGINRYEPPIINLDVMKRASSDALSYTSCEALEIYLDNGRKEIL